MGIQVDLLTRDKSCHQKEFIDFEFNGRHISEFGMVAVFDGDRHNFNASPEFEDETSEINGVSGQYYWGTRFKTMAKSFTLATDGITESEINEFKLHFKPGKYGKFIEDKLSCRYGWARVSNVSNFSVVPFLTKKTINIGGQEHIVEVNEYKGTAKLTFIFDDPFLYALNSKIAENNYSEDNLREAFLNNLPIENYSWSKDKEALFIGDGILNGSADSNKNISTLNFYNPSTIPTKTKLKLTFQPTFTTTRPTGNVLVFFKEIADNINNIGNQCNVVCQKDNSGEVISEFVYTSPNIVYQINKAIQVAASYYYNNLKTGWTVLGLEEALRLEITNPKVIGWATAILRIMKIPECGFYNSINDTFTTAQRTIDLRFTGATQWEKVNWLGYFNVYMLCLMANYGSASVLNENKTILEVKWDMTPYTVLFDGYNSETRMTYQYNYIDTEVRKSDVVEEKCGDMICSPYLKLDGGDSLNNEGLIKSTHSLTFLQNGAALPVSEVNLEYIYTYL